MAWLAPPFHDKEIFMAAMARQDPDDQTWDARVKRDSLASHIHLAIVHGFQCHSSSSANILLCCLGHKRSDQKKGAWHLHKHLWPKFGMLRHSMLPVSPQAGDGLNFPENLEAQGPEIDPNFIAVLPAPPSAPQEF